MWHWRLVAIGLASTLLGCGGAGASATDDDALPEVCQRSAAVDAAATPRAPDSPLTYVVGGTVMTANGDVYAPGFVAFQNGRILEVGAGEPTEIPAHAEVVDATGQYVTPGIIDTHSHLGVYPTPHVAAHSDGNEATAAATPNVQAMHSVWPQDPGFERAIAGGVTAMQILPGSANLVGGRGFVMQNLPGALVADALAFPGAPQTLKLACGENPKRVYGGRGQIPSTRMGSVAVMRQIWIDAQAYADSWSDYDDALTEWCEAGAPDGEEPTAPSRDLGKETLAGVLNGDILPQIHCYRADEMLTQIAIADEFGYAIRSFHHATDAYKIRDTLAEYDISASIWADWWGFKIEAYDSVVESAALLHEAGGMPVIHSDSAIGIQRLNQEAAKAYFAGVRAGVALDDNDVLRWITYNAAWSLGIEELTGTLEVGKRADVVLWSAHPFSVYARTEQVWIEGTSRWARAVSEPAWSDFETGLWPESVGPDPLPAAAGPMPPLALDALASYEAPSWSADAHAMRADAWCLTNANVFPVGGDPFVGSVCMQGDRIASVGPDVTPPAGATVFDVQGAVVTPGFVDVHTELGLVEISMVEDTAHQDEGGEDDVRAAFRVTDAFDPTSSLIGITREGGITSVVAAPTGGVISGQATWFNLGATPAPIEASAMKLRMGLSAGASRATTAGRFEEIFRDATAYAQHAARFDTRGVRDLSVSYLDLEALAPVVAGEMPVLAAAAHQVDVRAALALAARLGFDVTILNSADAWAIADELAAADAIVVLEPLQNLPSSFTSLGAREDGAALLARSGVRVALTTNSAHNVRLLRQYAGNAVRAGMPWMTALEAVTVIPAEVMGVSETYGRLAPGYVANVAVWSGDPFEASSGVELLVVEGRPVPITNRQTALMERYRTVPQSP